jgi:hypothetical protein
MSDNNEVFEEEFRAVGMKIAGRSSQGAVINTIDVDPESFEQDRASFGKGN